MNKDYLFQKVCRVYHLEQCSGYEAYATMLVNGKKKLLRGVVFDDKYFIDADTEEIYRVEEFYLIDNVEDFED